MYPYDNDEFDEEERALNASMKVTHHRMKLTRTKSPLQSSDPRRHSRSMARQSVPGLINGESSILRTKIIVNSSIYGTSSLGRICRISLRLLRRSIMSRSGLSNSWRWRRVALLRVVVGHDLFRLPRRRVRHPWRPMDKIIPVLGVRVEILLMVGVIEYSRGMEW
jgi:hypothetical protein